MDRLFIHITHEHHSPEVIGAMGINVEKKPKKDV